MGRHAPPDPYQPQPGRPGQPPAQMPPGHRNARESWPRRHKNLTALSGILVLWVVAGVATAAVTGGRASRRPGRHPASHYESGCQAEGIPRAEGSRS